MDGMEKFSRIKNAALQKYRDNINAKADKIIITVGMGQCSMAVGAEQVRTVFEEELKNWQCNNVVIETTGCIGLCSSEPLVDIVKPGQPRITYAYVTPEKARMIFAHHIIYDQVINEWTMHSEYSDSWVGQEKLNSKISVIKNI